MNDTQSSSPNIVFLDVGTADAGDLDFSELESIGQLTRHDLTQLDEISARIAEAQIILTNKTIITKEIIEAAPQLKLIQVVATGYNNVDIDAAKRHGIAVCNVSGYSTPSVAQHTLTLLLNLATQSHRYAQDHPGTLQLRPSRPCPARPEPRHEPSARARGHSMKLGKFKPKSRFSIGLLSLCFFVSICWPPIRSASQRPNYFRTSGTYITQDKMEASSVRTYMRWKRGKSRQGVCPTSSSEAQF